MVTFFFIKGVMTVEGRLEKVTVAVVVVAATAASAAVTVAVEAGLEEVCDGLVNDCS